MEYQDNMIYVGVDLHKEHHTAVIIDDRNRKLGEIQFLNKPAAFPQLLQEVKKYTKRGMKAVYGLEDIGGNGRALAVFLAESNCWVKEVNPVLSTARRKSHVTV